ncbi:hypothetical protein LNP05_07945 [Klebsiella pneumoniae subsp. pneumoniae]|nr:hypothetical protein [Klebsiella pneumoniae subsp. pneumoniae]
MHYNQYITSGQTSYKLREHFSMMILSIVATVVLLGALFYHRVSLLLSSVILLAWTAALGAAGVWNIWLLLPLAIILLPFNFAPMRKSMISAPAFRTFRKVMPPMSRTEKKPSTPAPPGGKAICFAAILTGKSYITIRSRG